LILKSSSFSFASVALHLLEVVVMVESFRKPQDRLHTTILMQQPTYPPPPPPPTSKALSGFHLPGTNLFDDIRRQLSALEISSRLPGGKSLTNGFIVAFIFAATASGLLAFLAQILISLLVGRDLTVAVFAPLTEEPFKALAMLVVVHYVWKTVPNRRYGAALGAAAGLGFGISEAVVYVVGSPTAMTVVLRALVIPLHPLASAFVGMGVFAMTAGKSVGAGSLNRSGSLFRLLFLTGVATHMLWNILSVVFGLVDLGLVALLLNIFFVFPLFAIILRDFLGGHFNFQNFFEPLDGQPTVYPEIPPPPPPPPPTYPQ
jgi:RsiW-degrading membrane proteinase PrsW (M82 family)